LASRIPPRSEQQKQRFVALDTRLQLFALKPVRDHLAVEGDLPKPMRGERGVAIVTAPIVNSSGPALSETGEIRDRQPPMADRREGMGSRF
jgi:hypothetical protein